ncbi:MAG: hypothetical protein A3C88_02515 [Candidatus Yanofskybacteria bacterium RIFCSPHIGHO2_02_FULL_50_12]|uniref:DUF8128 domain-containing protein n=1 Tax=Candidatus Yanofskybacteria bacterium RIFCSPHIGHO2_02_FULL_50_12 TaxID=1802685 RepID=A0A1F8FWW0_9BACT|nr:MAG: hypothetical protein A3C88_02515 [Candidatus Yanofskybacteria bacterium RIFCSPHIGHO2_02_FULL_50_12]
MTDTLFLVLNSLQSGFVILLSWWWFWVPLMLYAIVYGEMAQYNRLSYLSTLKWVLIEIRVPQEAGKSLKAMEQIFVALHAMAAPKPPKNLKERYEAWRDRFIKGKIPHWLSLEIISIGGEIHYYIRVLEEYRDVAEAQIYGHYPDAELTQVQDYLAQLPAALPTGDLDITGAEAALQKEDVIPIKTYLEFEEEKPGKEDVKRIDPLAPLAEMMSSMQFGEYLAIQFLIRPTGDGWVKAGQKVLDKIYEKPEKPRNDALDKTISGIEKGVGAIFGVEAAEEKKEDKKEGKKFGELSPGQQEVVKAMEKGFAKLAFETGIRILYVAPKDRFVASRVPGVFAAFKQYSTQALNGFKSGSSPEVKKGFGKAKKTLVNKEALFKRFKTREFPQKPFVLNTEELTTIFHFPDIGVKTPSLPRVEAKKGEPPAGLPTV